MINRPRIGEKSRYRREVKRRIKAEREELAIVTDNRIVRPRATMSNSDLISSVLEVLVSSKNEVRGCNLRTVKSVRRGVD